MVRSDIASEAVAPCKEALLTFAEAPERLLHSSTIRGFLTGTTGTPIYHHPTVWGRVFDIQAQMTADYPYLRYV